jgi:hypothetical protein
MASAGRPSGVADEQNPREPDASPHGEGQSRGQAFPNDVDSDGGDGCGARNSPARRALCECRNVWLK